MDYKYFFKGCHNGPLAIKFLEDHGGMNTYFYEGISDTIHYYINSSFTIDATSLDNKNWLLNHGYTEINTDKLTTKLDMENKKMYFRGNEATGKLLLKTLVKQTGAFCHEDIDGLGDQWVFYNIGGKIEFNNTYIETLLMEAGYVLLEEPEEEVVEENKSSRYCNLYYNNNTRKYKTGEHRYSTVEEAMENKANYPYYVYFDSIECSIKE